MDEEDLMVKIYTELYSSWGYPISIAKYIWYKLSPESNHQGEDRSHAEGSKAYIF